MGRIYRGAARVIVWLGDAPESLDDLLEGLEQDYGWDLPKLKLPLYFSADDKLMALSLLFSIRHTKPSWWKRMWVVQEYVVASGEPMIAFGRWEIVQNQLWLKNWGVVSASGIEPGLKPGLKCCTSKTLYVICRV